MSAKIFGLYFTTGVLSSFPEEREEAVAVVGRQGLEGLGDDWFQSGWKTGEEDPIEAGGCGMSSYVPPRVTS